MNKAMNAIVSTVAVVVLYHSYIFSSYGLLKVAEPLLLHIRLRLTRETSTVLLIQLILVDLLHLRQVL